MEKGWDASGLLEPLWGKVGGRDGLAEKTGIQPATISGYNTGRLQLGVTNARKIADALGVTIFDLGAPEAAAETPSELRVTDRLRRVEAALASLGPNLAALATLPERVTALERPAPPRTRRAGQR